MLAVQQSASRGQDSPVAGHWLKEYVVKKTNIIVSIGIRDTSIVILNLLFT